jgi:hypothetical protein
MVRTDDASNRYHIETLTSLDLAGYYSCWISFEFCKGSFAGLMKDEHIDLEFTTSCALVVEDELVESIITQRFNEIGITWVLEHDAVAVAPFRHFEGCCVLGMRSTVDEAIERVRDLIAE